MSKSLSLEGGAILVGVVGFVVIIATSVSSHSQLSADVMNVEADTSIAQQDTSGEKRISCLYTDFNYLNGMCNQGCKNVARTECTSTKDEATFNEEIALRTFETEESCNQARKLDTYGCSVNTGTAYAMPGEEVFGEPALP